jgi:hypothetical protein
LRCTWRWAGISGCEELSGRRGSGGSSGGLARAGGGEDEEGDADDDHEERVELAFGEAVDEGVGFAELLADDAEDGVEDEEETGEESVRGVREFLADGEEDGEEEEAFEGGLVELGGMARGEERAEGFCEGVVGAGEREDKTVFVGGCGGVEAAEERDELGVFVGGVGIGGPAGGFVGEADGPWDGGCAAVEFTVDEVGDSSEEEAGGGGDDEVVAETGPRAAVAFGPEEGKEEETGDAAVAGHAAAGDVDDGEWIGEEFGAVVKEHVAETAAEEDAEEGGVGDEVCGGLRAEFAAAAFGPALKDEVADEEAEHVGDAVPAQLNAVGEAQQDRVEAVQVVGKEHGQSCHGGDVGATRKGDGVGWGGWGGSWARSGEWAERGPGSVRPLSENWTWMPGL